MFGLFIESKSYNKIIKEEFNIKKKLSYSLIYLLFIIEILINIQAKYLWGDESFTFHLLQHNFLGIISLTSQDVHPFMYYFIAKVFTFGIGNTFTKILVLRLVSALPYLILLIIGNTYIKKKFSTLTSILFMLFIISMPLLIDNMSQVRMYGWATLFTTIFYIIFMHIYYHNNIKSFLWLSLFALLAAYTHYYALITVGIIYLIFLVFFIVQKKQLRYLLISISIDIFLYLPWLFVLFEQAKKASNSYWSDQLKLSDALHIFIGIISPVYHLSPFYILPIALIITLLIVIFKKEIPKDETFVINFVSLLTPFLLILAGSLASIIINHSVLIGRYIAPAMGIFWLAIAIIIGKISNQHSIIKYALITITLMTAILTYAKINHANFSIFKESNQSIENIQKLPKDSAFIYNNSEIMYGASTYVNNNYILRVLDKDRSFPIYDKTFDNIQKNNETNLPKNYKHVFYIKDINQDNHGYDSKITSQFEAKYHKREIAKFNVTNGEAAIYQIK